MRCAATVFGVTLLLSPAAWAQRALTWQEIKTRFEAGNPTLRAAQLSVDESRAQEITAYLRPNPEFTLATDGTQLSSTNGTWEPFAGTQFSGALGYLHERRHKRELRLESAQKATAVAQSQMADQERTLLFSLRNAFVQTLQAKAVMALANENLRYYDQVLTLSRERKKAGDIAQIDVDRLEVQRVQYETDIQTATVNLRTAKIQLLALLLERTPVEQFDVAGRFDFQDRLPPLEELHAAALESRPDLRAAIESEDKAKTDHRLAVANGSTDPTFAGWMSHNASFNNPFANNTIGASISIPLRVFDRNQGEKARTEIEIRRTERLRAATEAQAFSDVDSAYTTLSSNLTLLASYKARYLAQAVRVRETISFSYERGGASLLDFLQAQQDYRVVQLNYLNLIGAYLTSASQLNLAVGKEVIQ
ncbi:MAG TPA: TolC family protein [Candidatus Acidoferrum sp.]|nr:TolC family protein [Candidatus Acidoferrum sp.]